MHRITTLLGRGITPIEIAQALLNNGVNANDAVGILTAAGLIAYPVTNPNDFVTEIFVAQAQAPITEHRSIRWINNPVINGAEQLHLDHICIELKKGTLDQAIWFFTNLGFKHDFFRANNGSFGKVRFLNQIGMIIQITDPKTQTTHLPTEIEGHIAFAVPNPHSIWIELIDKLQQKGYQIRYDDLGDNKFWLEIPDIFPYTAFEFVQI